MRAGVKSVDRGPGTDDHASSGECQQIYALCSSVTRAMTADQAGNTSVITRYIAVFHCDAAR